MFSKVEVNGPGAHPLYKWMKDSQGSFPTSDVKWNFGKFLIDKEGKCVKRYAPSDSPMSLEGDISKLL